MLYERIMTKALNKNILLSASFELTYRCNIGCKMCYQSRVNLSELSTLQIKDILDQLANAGCLYLSLTGGEPLLREDFFQIAEYAKKKNFAISLQTNGTLISEEQARKIKELNFLQVQISILGANAKTHDAITQSPGSFDKAIRAVRLLVENKVDVVFKTTLIKDNYQEYHQITKLAEDLGAKPYFSPMVFPKDNKDKYPLSFRLNDDQLELLFADVFEEKQDSFPRLSETKEVALCNMGKTEANISPVGDVYPCVAVPISMGNLKEKSFKQIWHDSKKLDKIRTRSIDNMVKCKGCEAAPVCAMCPGLSILEDNNLFTNSTECCRITKLMKEVSCYEKEKV